MKLQRKPMAKAISSISVAMAIAATGVSAQTYEVEHVFSVDDLQVDFRGTTFGPAGTASDEDAICGIAGGAACPPEISPVTDKEGITLYPVDTEFGFDVVPFLGAQAKSVESPRDYKEGFVGNIEDGGDVVGIKVSNAETATYKVKPPLGTWCQGLGGTSVKCSTEHYTVLEHTLSCNEVIPYFFYDFDAGIQLINSFPDGSDSFDCAQAALDDNLLVIDDGVPGDRLTSAVPGEQMDANDNTTVRFDIAASSDYSVTLKDDGKPLYRWGGLIKRPNDVRLYARLPLPDAWKERDAGGELVNDFAVTSALLYVDHWITNNPNDQLRPEDLENEAATGRKPSYYIDDGYWKSLKDCYEGDGDYLDSDEGSQDPQPIGAGTIFKNPDFALDPGDVPGSAPTDKPFAFSADLVGGFSNGYYTTIDRDPFEWSYVDADATDTFDFVGSPVPLSAEELEARNLALVSGPRWRLKANKFGQDIPGLEIPAIECSAPPFTNANIRYEVGTRVTTVINLLDWDEEEGPSPLATSRGWVEKNEYVEEGDSPEGTVVSTNGLPMTEDFDLAVYIKGDRKPTALYSARLVINAEGGPVDPPEDPEIGPEDLSLSDPGAPDAVKVGVERTVEVLVNNSAEIAAVDVASVRFLADGELVQEVAVRPIDPASSRRAKFKWTADEPPRTIEWTMELVFDGEVIDTVTDTTIVRPAD